MTELPKGWESSTLGRVASIVRGVIYKKHEAQRRPSPGYVPLLRATNIDHRLGFDDLYYVPEGRVGADQYLRRGDVVVAASSGSVSVVGKSAQLAVDWEGTFGGFCSVIRPASQLLASFVGSYVQSDVVRERWSDLARGSNINNLRVDHFVNLPVPVAPLPEQERIVAAIEEAFSKLEAGEAGLRTVRRLLKRMRDAVLAAAVSGRLVPQDPTDTPVTKLLAGLGVQAIDIDNGAAVSDGWAWATLGSVSESVRNGIFVSRPPEVPPGVPILRIGAVRRLELDLNDLRFAAVDIDDPVVARALLAPGDLLFTRYNGNPAFVGACAVVPPDQGPLLHPDKLIRVVINRAVAAPTFVAIAASAGASRAFIEAATKTTAGQAGIAGSDLRLVPIPLAPIEEQRRIISEVERHFSFLNACERAVEAGLARSAALRRAVLKSAFEGKLVPQDSTDEPASVLLERIRAERGAEPKPARRTRRPA